MCAINVALLILHIYATFIEGFLYYEVFLEIGYVAGWFEQVCYYLCVVLLQRNYGICIYTNVNNKSVVHAVGV